MKSETRIEIATCDHCDTAWESAKSAFPNMRWVEGFWSQPPDRWRTLRTDDCPLSLPGSEADVAGLHHKFDELKQMKPCFVFTCADNGDEFICADCLRKIADECDSFQGKP